MPILDELKKMYVKLGGKVDQDHSYENTSEILDAMGDIIQSTIELPGVTSDDNGKVLKVVDGSWDKGDEGGLPQVTTSDEGKVLAVNSSGEWDKGDVPTELPSVTSEDEGKVLTVDNSGVWGADDIPSELPSVTASDSGKVLAVNSSGEWDKKDNTNVVIFGATWNSGGYITLKDNKTARDVYNVITQKKLPIIISYNNYFPYSYTYYYPISDSNNVTICCILSTGVINIYKPTNMDSSRFDVVTT